MRKVNLMGYLVCLVASTVGISVVIPDLIYHVPAEAALFSVCILTFVYALTNIIKSVC